MSREFLNAVPPYYEDIYEFNVLDDVVSDRYSKIDEAFDLLENDQFVLTSSEAAVAIRERDFAIRVNPKSESLDFRKARILTHMQSRPPYVYEYLYHVLETLLGIGRFHLNLSIDDFEMETLIDADGDYYHETNRLLERIVPLNIDITLAVGIIREVIRINTGTYAWRFNAKICGRFRTAPRPGNIDGLPTYQSISAYAFPFAAPITSRFTTATRPGAVGDNSLSIEEKSYSFAVNRKRCGHFRAGGV